MNTLLNFNDLESLFASIRSSVNEDTLSTCLRRLLDNYAVVSFEMGRGNVFWRGRRIDNKPFLNVADLSYPPARFVKHGRLNNAGAPMLYAAIDEETVLHELKVKEGDIVQFIGFRVKAEETLRLAVIGELNHVRKTGYARAFGSDPRNSLNSMLNAEGFEAGKRLIYVDAFLASLLSDPNASANSYVTTRMLGLVAIEKSGADGFFYPSVQDPLGMNLVISPKQYDLATHVVRSYTVRVTKIREFGCIDYEILEEAQSIDESGEFKWVKPEPNLARYFGLTKKEFDFLQENPHAPNGSAIREMLTLYARNQ